MLTHNNICAMLGSDEGSACFSSNEDGLKMSDQNRLAKAIIVGSEVSRHTAV